MTCATRAAAALGLALIIAGGCSGSQNQTLDNPCSNVYPDPSGGTQTPTGNNVLAITIDGSSCNNSAYPGNAYFDEPCASVTICQISSGKCVTINDMLVDTGSYGVRVFASALQNANAGQPFLGDAVMSGSNNVAECAEFGTGSDWGSVQLYNIGLAGENMIQSVPVQVIDDTYSGGAPSGSCGTPDTDPGEAGFNGILGIGIFAEDCGSYCVTNASNGAYYSCNGTSCAGTELALNQQVINPVALLATDNQGVGVILPTVPQAGTTSTNGYVVLGIGTQTNNTPSGVTTYTADTTYGDFNVTVNSETDPNTGQPPTYPGFIDSGSNAFYFDPGNLSDMAQCSGGSGYYCPGCSALMQATNMGMNSSQGSVSFQIADLATLNNNEPQYNVFGNMGGQVSGYVDWGLPFFFGRTIYVGIDGQTSSQLGTGPYWAY